VAGAVDEYLAGLAKEQREALQELRRTVRSAVLEAHKDELGGFDPSNTVVRFSPDEPIPDHLVTKLLKARKAELDA
jgi:uncharacterized protein YdhG (YjbR/CyaY superfamily)